MMWDWIRKRKIEVKCNYIELLYHTQHAIVLNDFESPKELDITREDFEKSQ